MSQVRLDFMGRVSPVEKKVTSGKEVVFLVVEFFNRNIPSSYRKTSGSLRGLKNAVETLVSLYSYSNFSS